MKSKLQLKPEIMVVAMAVMFLLSSTASAAISPATISVDEIGDYVYGELVATFWMVALIMGAVAGLLFMVGTVSSNMWGTRIVKGIVVGLFVFYVLPWLIGQIQDLSTGGNTTAFNTTS